MWSRVGGQKLFDCSIRISPIGGAPSLSQSSVIAGSGPSEIHQADCNSHPAPAQCCTEDETPVVYTYNQSYQICTVTY